MIDICVPKIGLVSKDVDVLTVLVAVGDQVTDGQPLAEIEGDKSTYEIESECDGVVTEVLAQPGATANVGDVLIRIDPKAGAR